MRLVRYGRLKKSVPRCYGFGRLWRPLRRDHGRLLPSIEPAALLSRGHAAAAGRVYACRLALPPLVLRGLLGSPRSPPLPPLLVGPRECSRRVPSLYGPRLSLFGARLLVTLQHHEHRLRRLLLLVPVGLLLRGRVPKLTPLLTGALVRALRGFVGRRQRKKWPLLVGKNSALCVCSVLQVALWPLPLRFLRLVAGKGLVLLVGIPPLAPLHPAPPAPRVGLKQTVQKA